MKRRTLAFYMSNEQQSCVLSKKPQVSLGAQNKRQNWAIVSICCPGEREREVERWIEGGEWGHRRQTEAKRRGTVWRQQQRGTGWAAALERDRQPDHLIMSWLLTIPLCLICPPTPSTPPHTHWSHRHMHAHTQWGCDAVSTCCTDSVMISIANELPWCCDADDGIYISMRWCWCNGIQQKVVFIEYFFCSLYYTIA